MGRIDIFKARIFPSLSFSRGALVARSRLILIEILPRFSSISMRTLATFGRVYEVFLPCFMYPLKLILSSKEGILTPAT